MWLIQFHAVPKPETEASGKAGGAYVSCWILFAWQDGAELLARFEVEKEWTITVVEESTWVELEDYNDDPENREYYLQAQSDGGCFVFHWYPPEADEIDEDLDSLDTTA